MNEHQKGELIFEISQKIEESYLDVSLDESAYFVRKMIQEISDYKKRKD